MTTETENTLRSVQAAYHYLHSFQHRLRGIMDTIHDTCAEHDRITISRLIAGGVHNRSQPQFYLWGNPHKKWQWDSFPTFAYSMLYHARIGENDGMLEIYFVCDPDWHSEPTDSDQEFKEKNAVLPELGLSLYKSTSSDIEPKEWYRLWNNLASDVNEQGNFDIGGDVSGVCANLDWEEATQEDTLVSHVRTSLDECLAKLKD